MCIPEPTESCLCPLQGFVFINLISITVKTIEIVHERCTDAVHVRVQCNSISHTIFPQYYRDAEQ